MEAVLGKNKDLGGGGGASPPSVAKSISTKSSSWKSSLMKSNRIGSHNSQVFVSKPFRSTWKGSILIGIVFLCTFGGVFTSILGTLGCEFLGYHHGSIGEVSSSASTASNAVALSTSDNIFSAETLSRAENRTFVLTPSESSSLESAVDLTWIGIFSYSSDAFEAGNDATEAETTDASTNESTMYSPFTTAASFCVEYDSDYFFRDAPYRSLFVAQVCAILAPTLCLLSFLLFFLDFADICENFHRHIRLLSFSAFLMFLMAAILQAMTLIVFLEPELCERDETNTTEYACTFGTGAWLVVASASAFFVCAIALLAYYWSEERYYFRLLLDNDEEKMRILEDTTDTDSSGNENFNLYDGYMHDRQRAKKSRSRRSSLHANNPAISTMRQNMLQQSLVHHQLDPLDASDNGSNSQRRSEWHSQLDKFVNFGDDFDFYCGDDKM